MRLVAPLAARRSSGARASCGGPSQRRRRRPIRQRCRATGVGPRVLLVTRPPSSAGGETAVEVRGLTKRYGGADGVLALDRLDLDVPAGSVFGLLGPNGAGKTTTLRILAGLAHPSAGEAVVAGTRIDGGGPGLTRRIGFLDQDPRYYGWATGNEIVMLAGLLHGMRGSALEQRTREIVARSADRSGRTAPGDLFGRDAPAARHPQRSSTGTAAILDEPVSSLDRRAGATCCCSSPSCAATRCSSRPVLSDVERICDRIGILDQAPRHRTARQLLDRYALPVYRLDPEEGQAEAVERLASRLRALDWATNVAVEHGRLQVTVADPARAARELLPVVAESGVALVTYARERPTLEDVFLQLVGRDGEAAA
jgi:ABC-2 type transport system ATP-binding protein